MIANPLLNDIFPKTFLAINFIRSFTFISGKHIYPAFVAFPAVKLSFAPQRHTLLMSACRTEIGQRQFLRYIELLFLRNRQKLLTAPVVLANQHFLD